MGAGRVGGLLRMSGHNATVSLGPVLELSPLPSTPVVRPLATRQECGAAEPCLRRHSSRPVGPLPGRASCGRWQLR
jgi:hypothetical protein